METFRFRLSPPNIGMVTPPLKLRQEKNEIEKHLASCGNQMSNLDKALDSVMSYAGKLNTMWDSAD